jgi:hypothetical protein
MECFFGDAILFKVEKDHLEEDDQIAHFKVISMCNEVDVVNKFIDEYPSMDENIELVYHVLSSLNVHIFWFLLMNIYTWIKLCDN